MSIFIHADNFFAAGNSLGADGLTVTSTAAGYNKDNIRDPNLFTGWKPADSTINEYAQLHLFTPLTVSATYFWGMAIDKRMLVSGDRTTMTIRGATSAGGAYTTLGTASHGIGNGNGFITVGCGSFVAASAWTHIRFHMDYTGAGTDAGPILLYAGLTGTEIVATGLLILPTERGLHTNVAVQRSVARAYLSNSVAIPQYEAEFNFKAVDAAGTFTEILNMFGPKQAGGARCLFVHSDAGELDIPGFNSAGGQVGVVRLDGSRLRAVKYYNNAVDVPIPFVTEPYTLV